LAYTKGKFMAALKKSRNKMIAGVCGGLAEWLGWDPTVVRLGYVLVSILSVAFPGLLVYIVLWVVMPAADSEE
jgi:phage shock protein PspC (stress-responsive transcriptional regulator)